MTSCCHRHRMRWSGATGAIARCKNRSTGYARRCRSVHAWRWICGVKPTPKAVNKPSPHFIVHGLDKPGVFTTVSILKAFSRPERPIFTPKNSMKERLLVQSRVFLGSKHEIWSKQHNGKVRLERSWNRTVQTVRAHRDKHNEDPSQTGCQKSVFSSDAAANCRPQNRI